MQKILVILILLCMSWVQVACQRSNKESVLIIAVDDLLVTDVNCAKDSTEESRSGFELLCKDSIRFTHAFTTSTMSVPALGSIYTGLYPFENKLRTNGDYLSSSVKTAASVAAQKSYRTAFFSGGAPVLRKSGLNQGFEVFDDYINPTINNLFRPLNKSVQLFKTWLKLDAQHAPFFATIYAPDLIYTNTETLNDLGVPRNLSFESQLEELNENLFNLFDFLKKSNLWDQTTIILVGLNGHTNSDRVNEPANINLHAENTQVALLVKPSQKKRDQGITWKVDTNISLVDIGPTLFELLKEPLPNTNPDFPAISLSNIIKQTDKSSDSERALLVESSWGVWQNKSNTRAAVIKGHTLFLNDSPMKIYNTLVDRLENTPLPVTDSYTFSPYTVYTLLKKYELLPWTGFDSLTLAKLNLERTRWSKPEHDKSIHDQLKLLIKKYPADLELAQWTAQLALEQKDWSLLKELGKKNNQAFWTYVAEKNMNSTKFEYSNPCLDALKLTHLDLTVFKACTDPLMLDFIDWQKSELRSLNRDLQKKKFERNYRSFQVEWNILKQNLSTGFIWDTNQQSHLSPEMIELTLNLPEYTKIKSQLEKYIKSNLTPDDY